MIFFAGKVLHKFVFCEPGIFNGVLMIGEMKICDAVAMFAWWEGGF